MAAQTRLRGGGDPRYLRQTCEQSLKNLGIETLDVFCMSRVDPNVPVEESVGGADSGGSRPRIRDDVAHHSDLMSLGVPR